MMWECYAIVDSGVPLVVQASSFAESGISLSGSNLTA